MTRRTLASPAGRKTTEALAQAFEPGAAPGTAPSGDGSPNRNRIAAGALYDGSGAAILDGGVPRAAQDVEYDLDGDAVRFPGKLRQTVGASWDALGRMTTFVEGTVPWLHDRRGRARTRHECSRALLYGTGGAAGAPHVEQAVTTTHEPYRHGILDVQRRPRKRDGKRGPVNTNIKHVEDRTRGLHGK